MGELLHGERNKSRIGCGIHTVKDGFLLLDVDWHFSKLKPSSNGDEDQARALGDSCSSLSLSRNRSVSLKLESPSLLAEICLKRHHWAKHGRGHGRALLQPARALARVNYTASLLGETRPACWEKHGRAFGWTRPCFGGHGRVISQPCPCFG
ncbi:unnamed protein product [Linum trigynum]|uniref:Uncharacterized protein n=1 Tax=Linum trigynum TaxID=586398 RepID=A0AAV2FC65_9ROSI